MSVLDRLFSRGRSGASSGSNTRNRPNPVSAELLASLDRLEDSYRSIRPWLLPRPEDSTLIVPPNRVYKLAGSAFPLFSWMDAGGRLRSIPDLDEQKAQEIRAFLEDLLAASTDTGQNGVREFERVTYDFDFTRLPILGELALTYRCNARCRFCYAACGEEPAISRKPDAAGARIRAEMDTSEARRIIDIFKNEAKIPFFSFTRGEPLLRQDLEELAAYARSLGLRTNLITNGTLITPERALSLRESGIDTAQVSLESPDSAIHDTLCALPGAWRKTVAGIEALQKAGVSIQTNSTLTALNRESLSGMPDFLARLGVHRFSMNLFIPSGRGLGDEELTVLYRDCPPFIEEIRKTARALGLTFFWYSPIPYCIYNPLAKGLGNKSCAAMDGLLHVNPAGEILPCSSWPESMGNLLTTPFKDIWFSERALHFKRKGFAPAACTGCARFVACQGACPLYIQALGEQEIVAARGGCRGC